MQRTRKKNKYQKLGGGNFRMAGGRIIKPGQRFEAHPEDIPNAFRNTVQLIQDNETPEVKKQIKEASKYTVQQRETAGWYDVVDSKGKPLNENALREDDAKELKESLE